MTPLWENSDKRTIHPRPLSPQGLDLVSYDIHNFKENNERTDKLIKVINTYGCGSCGPRGFYGGTMEHLDLEEELL